MATQATITTSIPPALLFIHAGRPIGCFQHPDRPQEQYRDSGYDRSMGCWHVTALACVRASAIGGEVVSLGKRCSFVAAALTPET